MEPVALMSDRQIETGVIAACQRGDREAFQLLFETYKDRVYAIALYFFGGNEAQASDITQQVFLKLFTKIAQFRSEAEFTTWLYRLTTNRVLMYFRKASVRREQTTDDGSLPDQAFTWRATGGHLPLLDRIALDKAIARLPPGYRLVFILHDVFGHEHEEIARILGCSAGTSKSQLHKARLRLRGLIRGRDTRRDVCRR